ncbi:MAG TPA: thiamine pyrophosphate-dependent enzyme [Salinivirgaceae bacterium]|nr:thiamine pyrophosphate-dependent enzyme [Salinivirgaceae bacterium]
MTKHKMFDIERTLNDYYLVNLSRQLSILGRKEVLTGKAKFGIFGDGKEVAQVAMAHQFKDGDWRAGYYRDQTFMLATGMYSAREFFSSLYGHTDLQYNPSHGGRSFNNHFGTRSLDENGEWKDLTKQKNSSADISPTAGQMPRLLGLAYASKIYRNVEELKTWKKFSDNGNEVAFGTIGDASTSEGHFWETLNAAAVLQIPLAISIWDDGFGISVPKKYQTVKESISKALEGFQKETDTNGILIFRSKGWDYPHLIQTYAEGIQRCRKDHIPVLFHIEEMTQPQGHSTSGSHERYKSAERLQWEIDFDPIKKMKEWLLSEGYAFEKTLTEIEQKAANDANKAKDEAWEAYTKPLQEERNKLVAIIEKKNCVCKKDHYDKVTELTNNLKRIPFPIRKDNFSAAKRILRHICIDCPQRKELQKQLSEWLENGYNQVEKMYSSHLYSETKYSYKNVKEVKPRFSTPPQQKPGREILRDNFHHLFSQYPNLITFGEDTGNIGDVNQGLEGLQAKFGQYRISDTGIREATILGQAIGAALRGLRPIAEIQYFDYLLYALQTMSDDLATMRWRTNGGQKAPVIIRTRGHRLEGIWHSGSPMSMVLNSIRGILVAVPRNMTQAAGMYNTLLQTDETALIIEPLNGYRLRENTPQNLGEYTIPLGQPEILVEGTDITIVTYGSCVRIAQETVEQLKDFNIHAELIDVQTLIPFDDPKIILKSLQKTNRIVFFDEDYPSGTTAFMMQKVLEEHGGYQYLDSPPATLTAKDHRPAYGTDGDYFSKPNSENLFEKVYQIMHESNPKKYPGIF